MNDDAIITKLGGTSAVAIYCGTRLSRRVTTQMVSNWRKHGIPFLYRPSIKAMARELGVIIPIDFVPGEFPIQEEVIPNGQR